MAKDVIIFTDGDDTAYHALSVACKELDLHPLRASRGNPTPLTGDRLIRAVVDAPRDPVVVMVDDRGDKDKGIGERALEDLVTSPELHVLGVIAVASNTHPVKGVMVDGSITNASSLVSTAVDKAGDPTQNSVLHGDTVDVLNREKFPIVGLGDPGKMQGKDSIERGVPITKEALEEILRRSGYHGR